MGNYIIIEIKYGFNSKDIVMYARVIETSEGDPKVFSTYDQAKRFIDKEVEHTRLMIGIDDGTKYRIVDLNESTTPP